MWQVLAEVRHVIATMRQVLVDVDGLAHGPSFTEPFPLSPKPPDLFLDVFSCDISINLRGLDAGVTELFL